jgi:hypothetical protein
MTAIMKAVINGEYISLIVIIFYLDELSNNNVRILV